LHVCYEFFQGIELVFPEPLVEGNPRRRILERLRMQAAAAHAPVFVVLQQAGTVQYPQVLGHRGQRHAEGLRQLAHRGLPLGQPGQDGAAGGVGQRAKGGVESGQRILNHTV